LLSLIILFYASSSLSSAFSIIELPPAGLESSLWPDESKEAFEICYNYCTCCCWVWAGFIGKEKLLSPRWLTPVPLIAFAAAAYTIC